MFELIIKRSNKYVFRALKGIYDKLWKKFKYCKF